jgi:hypothetical protein
MQFYRFLVVVFLMIVGNSLQAQDIKMVIQSKDSLYLAPEKFIYDTTSVSIGYKDAQLKELLKTDSLINAKNPWFYGWRVQIFLGGGRQKEKAFEMKHKFEQLFPGERAYVVYAAPDFRVRVGNFKSKLESIGLYKACQRYFPNCYPVRTKILFADLMPIVEEKTDSLLMQDSIVE